MFYSNKLQNLKAGNTQVWTTMKTGLIQLNYIDYYIQFLRCLIIFHFFSFSAKRRIIFLRSIWISSPAAFLFYALIRHSSMLSAVFVCVHVCVHMHSCTCVCKDDFSNIMFLNLTRSYKLVKKKKQRVIKRGKITELQWNGSLSALVLIQSVSKGSFVMPLPQHTNLLDQVCQNIDWK